MVVKLVQLKGFCKVMQSPNYSLTKTAEKIHIEQSALSKQISALEKELDIKLFDRSEHKKLKPTKEGELFYKEAIKYMNGIEGLVGNFKEQLKGFNDKRLSIALYETAAAYVFPKILGEMLKIEEFKGLEIVIYNISKDEAVRKLVNKEIDLAFYINDSRDIAPPEIELAQSFKNSIALIFNKNHPLAKKDKITKKDIESYKFLERDLSETKTNNLVQSYFDIIPSNIKIVSATFENITETIKYTDNIAMIPEIFLKNNEAVLSSYVTARNIDYLFKDAFFNIMTLKNYSLKKSVLWVMEKLKKLAPKEK